MVQKGMLGLLLMVLWGGVRAEDLGSIYREAVANDAQYRAARAQYAAVEERVPQSLAALRPAVSVSSNTTWNEINSNTLHQQQYNSNAYTVTLTQPLLRQQSFIGVDQSRSLLDQAKAQLDQARQELAIRTAQAYFDVLFAQDALNTFKVQRAANLQQSDQAKRSFEVGTATIIDVRDAKARYDLVTAQEISARNDLASKTQALHQIIKKDPGPLATLRPAVVLMSPTPDNMDAWVKVAETNSTVVLAAEAAMEAARLEAKKARAAHLPTLDLVATQGFARSGTITTIGTDVRSNTIGFQLAMPIYSGGGTTAHERELVALLEKSDAELDGARRTGALTAKQAYLGVTSGLAQVQALEEALSSARAALEANKKGFEIGTRINIDVLNAQQQVAVTERDAAKARYDTLMFLLRLKGAAGSLTERDVQELNELLAK